MKITENNKELVKAFIRVLRDIGVSQTTSEMICSMLKSKAQLDEVVNFIEKNPKATENEILEKATEIAKEGIP